MAQDLLPLLRERLHTSVLSPLLADLRAELLFTAGGRLSWVVKLDNGVATVSYGRPRRPDVTIQATVPVLTEVVSGARGGIAAFLDGDLIVRGNLALALEIDGLFPPPPEPHPAKQSWFHGTHHAAAQRSSASATDNLRALTSSVVAADIRTFYLEAGRPDAPPVVLMHGVGATNASMLPLLAALAEDFHVLAPDLPGHGGSQSVSGRHGPEFFGEWLSAFLARTCNEPAVLIGNSLGGRTAIQVALDHPEVVRALVLLCPAVAYRRLRQFVPFVRLMPDELSIVKMPIPRAMITTGMRALFAKPSDLPAAWIDAAADEFLRVWNDRGSRYAIFSALRHLYLDAPFGDVADGGVAGFWDRLPSLTQPVLFIWGDKDVLVPSGFARFVTEALPSAESHVLTDCGHIPQFERREETNALIGTFLQALPQRHADASTGRIRA